MKKIIFSALAIFISALLFSQNYDLSVSGYVTDNDNGDPVEQQMLNISILGDSLNGGFYYFNSVFTDANGFYSDSISVPDGEEGELTVQTMGCMGNMLSETEEFSASENEIEIDFEVCSDSTGGGGDECMAMFSYQPANIPLTIQFTDLSYGFPDSWEWDFGDGSDSEDQNPLHTYTEEGEYIVTLEISSDSNDCSSYFEMPVWVGNDSINYDMCMAMFFYYPDSVDFTTINFVDMSSGMMGQTPSSWFWEFGDGTSSNEQNPVHNFSAEGDFVVCLTIETIDSLTNDTCRNTMCMDVIVEDWNYNCEAWYYYYPVMDSTPSGGNELTFQFMDYSYGNPTSWEWDFGDGNTSDEQNPIHTFDTEGNYEVCLTIYSDSCESNYCEDVYIFNDTIEQCYTWFEYELNDLDASFEAFSNRDSNNIFYTWDFGDGVTATGQYVEHSYAQDGMYLVTLMAQSNDSSCSSVYTEMLMVGNDFSFDVEGNVYVEDSSFADFATVYLMAFDSLGQNLISLESTQVDDNGHYVFSEPGFENCMYFVQAELNDNSVYYGDYLPTYHFDALNWEDAWPVFPMPMGMDYDIYMIPDSNAVLSGQGNIYGMLSENVNRELMPNVEILLMNQDMYTLTYLRTDENGEFQFPDLAYGTYVVYTEIVGVETEPVSIILSQDSPDANINIVVANGVAALSVNQVSAMIEEVGQVSPNPIIGNAKINVNLKTDSKVSVSILNQFGQVLQSTDYNLNEGSSQINIDAHSMKAGLYLLNVKAEDGISFVRKFVISR